MILSVQCAIGAPGSKPVTQLKYLSAPFPSLVNAGSHQYALNDGGAWQLNYGETDDGQPVTYAFTLNASHFGDPAHVKKLRYIYAAMKGGYSKLSVKTKADNSDFDRWTKCSPKQVGFRAAVGSRRQGVYWTVGLETTEPFTLFGLSVLYQTRPAGVSNGCNS